MVKSYLVEFKEDSGKYKIGEQAILDKHDYQIHKKSVRILRLYSHVKMVRK